MTAQRQMLPWTRSCFVCGETNQHGLRLRSCVEADGRVTLEHQTRTEDLGYSNIVHGGIAATLLDEVMTWSAIIDMHQPCVAAEMSFRLKLPITVGARLRVSGWVVRNRRRILLTEGVIHDDDDRVMVSATGKYVPMAVNSAAMCEKDFVEAHDVISPAFLFGQSAGAHATADTNTDKQETDK